MSRPLIAITMGDPSGVGPEIIMKALSKPEVHVHALPLVIGDRRILEYTAQNIGQNLQKFSLREVKTVEEALSSVGQIPVLDLKNVDRNHYQTGRVDSRYGKAAGQYIEKAIEWAMAQKVEAVVTCPIQKESFRAAGYSFNGHTEMFGTLTGASSVALMLMVDQFRVVHVTLHQSLKQAVQDITTERVYEVIRVAHEGCVDLGVPRPRIAVAGLNPHAGESGLFGDEERKAIDPAIRRAQGEGLSVQGPFSSDTVFPLMKGGRFDLVVCMYHDQGGIPMKLLSFEWDEDMSRWSRIRGVNVTLGLPIVRTSVSHGTGFEIAGQGIADSGSLEEAIGVAAGMAHFRNEKRLKWQTQNC